MESATPALSEKAKQRITRLQALGAKIETKGWKAPTIALWDKKKKETWTWIQIDIIDTGYTDEEFEIYYQDFVAIAEENKKPKQK